MCGRRRSTADTPFCTMKAHAVTVLHTTKLASLPARSTVAASCCRYCRRQVQQVSGRHSYWTRLQNHTTDPLSCMIVLQGTLGGIEKERPRLLGPSRILFWCLTMRIRHRLSNATGPSSLLSLLLLCLWLRLPLLAFSCDFGCELVANCMSSDVPISRSEGRRRRLSGHIIRCAQSVYAALQNRAC